ncbi:cyclic nucleotide-binding domain-containing protein [bacterium]|nr:cyclic nucleotide-binding domain-containing protein [bacterium]MCI0604662.1 cyclic nucleotide-binding domain-containing protein [bacterium]
MFWKKKSAEDYIGKKQYQKAIALYREKLQEQPRNTALLMNIADTLLMDKQVDHAIREYKKIAVIQTEQGFILKAIAVYKKILKIQPGNAEVEHLLSNLSERLAMTEQSSPVEKAKTPPLKETEEANLEIENKLLKDLSPDEFKQVVAKLNLRHFEEGAVVVKEGDPGDSLFVVVHGEVRVLTRTPLNKEVFLANLGEGEFFGEIALLTGKPRTATIITNTRSELLELTKEDYEKIILRYPNVKKVVEEFHVQRTYKTVEAMIQAAQEKP